MLSSLKRWFLTGTLIHLPLLLYAAGSEEHAASIRPSLESYQDDQMTDLVEILTHRISEHPFNLVATILFACAILHTFLASQFLKIAHKWEHEHQNRVKKQREAEEDGLWHDTHFGAEIMHFLGEVEVIFGLWVLPLIGVALYFFNWADIVHHINDSISYTEPMFVVVIMALASTRPVMQLAETCLGFFARLGGDSPAAWWFSILTLAPLLGSFITEPAAMTISALLLARQFYELKPSHTFAYATIGLLFVNVSVGGTLSHFAAPPVLMVVTPWNWDLTFMFMNFGWKAALGIVIANVLYFLVFRKEFATLNPKAGTAPQTSQERTHPVPVWIIVVHIIVYGLDRDQCALPGFVCGRVFVLSRVCPRHPAPSKRV